MVRSPGLDIQGNSIVVSDFRGAVKRRPRLFASCLVVTIAIIAMLTAISGGADPDSPLASKKVESARIVLVDNDIQNVVARIVALAEAYPRLAVFDADREVVVAGEPGEGRILSYFLCYDGRIRLLCIGSGAGEILDEIARDIMADARFSEGVRLDGKPVLSTIKKAEFGPVSILSLCLLLPFGFAALSAILDLLAKRREIGRRIHAGTRSHDDRAQ